MVAPDTKWQREPLEEPLAIMAYVSGPPVHGAMCTHHTSAENASNALMSKADAEDRNATGKLAYDGIRYSGLNRSAGSGRDDDCAWIEANNVADADLVVPDNLRCFTKLAKVACNVEDEGVIVVDDDDQNAPDASARNASKIRCALTSVSSYSAAGSDIAVIPPPA